MTKQNFGHCISPHVKSPAKKTSRQKDTYLVYLFIFHCAWCCTLNCFIKEKEKYLFLT